MARAPAVHPTTLRTGFARSTINGKNIYQPRFSKFAFACYRTNTGVQSSVESRSHRTAQTCTTKQAEIGLSWCLCYRDSIPGLFRSELCLKSQTSRSAIRSRPNNLRSNPPKSCAWSQAIQCAEQFKRSFEPRISRLFVRAAQPNKRNKRSR